MMNLYDNFNKLKAMPIGQSKYFKWSEALYLKQVNSYAYPSIPQASEIEKLAMKLEYIREYFKRPITINSWLRPDAYNKLIGGATFSHHRTGAAVDFEVNGLSADYVREELKKRPELIQGLSFETGITWVHIQNDGRGIWFPPPPKKKGLLDV
jgi:hypothetical protein